MFNFQELLCRHAKIMLFEQFYECFLILENWNFMASHKSNIQKDILRNFLDEFFEIC